MAIHVPVLHVLSAFWHVLMVQLIFGRMLSWVGSRSTRNGHEIREFLFVESPRQIDDDERRLERVTLCLMKPIFCRFYVS